MKCDDAKNLMIDYLYGEAGDDQTTELLAHIRQCAACNAELEAMQAARRSVQEHMTERGGTGLPAWAGFQPVVRGRADKTPASRPRRTWAYAAMAAAAVLLIAAGVVLFYNTQQSQVMAQMGPLEIKRTSISLTIFSTPEGMGDMRMTPQASQALVNDYYRPYEWEGMALVRDGRLAQNLPKGVSPVTFTDVPAGILPDSVHLEAAGKPGDLTILEQNYQYDLASADAILYKYIDQPITVTYKDGQTATGNLLSYDSRTLVIAEAAPEVARASQPVIGQRGAKDTGGTPVPPQGAMNIARDKVKAVTLAKLPEGLLTRPTLVWQLSSAAQERRQDFEVSYLTKGLSWRADYVLRLKPAKAGAGSRRGDSQSPRVPEILDTGEIVGYATVTNRSGVTFDNAQLKLMAGDVRFIEPLRRNYLYDSSDSMQNKAKENEAGFQEKSFFEYHLYTLQQATTIRNAETKQIELVTAAGLGMKRAYVYDRQQNTTAARVVSEIQNTKANHMGMPLPKGVVRLYAPDPEGVDTYIAQTTIDHTPAGQKLRLPWGYAFDITCSSMQMDRQRRDSWSKDAWQYSIRSAKDYDVMVTAVIHVPATTTKFEVKQGLPWHIRELGVIEIDVPVKAFGQAEVDFTYEYDYAKGGGLRSPYDK